jgi:hypothetical protein
MKLTFLERAYIANLCRRRALALRDNAAATKSSSQQVELTEEARHTEGLALRLDDGEELVLERKDPIQVNPRLDLDQLDTVGGPQ